MKMSRLLIFIFIASLGIFAIVALFAVGSESWHEESPHKIQHGLFPFWQTVDDGRVSGKSSSRILYAGLVETALAGVGIIFIICFAWAKLIGTTFEQNQATDHETYE
jgi:ABC-type oligopeptide transport system substrate-binding subunit